MTDSEPSEQPPTFNVMIEPTTARWGGTGGKLAIYEGLLLLWPSRLNQEWERFVVEGADLAACLQAELGSQVEVRYRLGLPN
jgi:hypothetical protein